MSALIELRSVGRVHPGGVHAVRDLDLDVHQGELVGVVGASGSGKSTLLGLIGTLDLPTSGTVRIDGHDVSRLSDRRLSELRALRIGFVFQRFHLTDAFDALTNVAEGALYTGLSPRERVLRATRALERVGLGHRGGHRPNELSGGERQRVAIARALVSEPDIVLADEPTGNLDSASGARIMTLLRELNADGATVLVITHDRETAASLPRRVGLRDGLLTHDETSQVCT